MQSAYSLVNFCIASVWFINGMLCKVVNLVPRHQEIVARILGSENARAITILIGFAEIVMAIWIFNRFRSRLNTIMQIVIVASMNLLEFFLAQDLLLWGKFNLLFALIFCLVVYFNEFYLKEKFSPR